MGHAALIGHLGVLFGLCPHGGGLLGKEDWQGEPAWGGQLLRSVKGK